MDSIEEQLKKSVNRMLRGLAIDAVEELQNTCPYASGHLASNIDYQISDLKLTITMPFYAEYVEYGAPPHFPPLDAIREWLRVKGLPDEMAYPVALSISKNGTRPNPFIRAYIHNKLKRDIVNNFK